MKKSVYFWLQYVVILIAMTFSVVPISASGANTASEVKFIDLNQYYSPRQYVTISFEVQAADYAGSEATAQLLIDDRLIASNSIVLKDTLKSQLRTTLPEDLVDGEHKLGIHIMVNGEIICEAYSSIIIAMPDLSLIANDREMRQSDILSFPATEEKCTVAFSTRNPIEQITSITTSTKVYTVNASEKVITLNLDKAQSESLTVTISSACHSQEKAYSITVSRNSDVTALTASFLSAEGNEYQAALSNDVYEFALPTFEQSGTLSLKVVDSEAIISHLNGVAQGTRELSIPVTVDDQNIYFDVNVQTNETSKLYSVHITNANFTPSVSVINAAEIAGTTYGSQGLYHNGYIPYGKKSTSVEEARLSGKTHGIVIGLEVSDINEGQYLAGEMLIRGEPHQIHWGSFDGPTVIQSGTPSKGYIYIDSSYFEENLPMSSYMIKIGDYQDATLRESISLTSVYISFAVQTVAGKFTAFYDPTSMEIPISTSSKGTFSYRKSVDGGVTWTEPASIVDTITVTDEGTSLYEITLEDYMRNKFSKLITVTVPKKGTQLQGTNIFLSTTRQADYIYLNTKKQNVDSVDMGIFELFEASE